MPKRQHLIEEAATLTQQLLDKGKIIEAGWIGYRAIVMHPDCPPRQLDDTRSAFFAGAKHLFDSIMVGLTPDKEPTETDLVRMGNIDEELKEFLADFKRRHNLG